MSLDQVDTLEDWVAIKDNPFLEKEAPLRLYFHVAWNPMEWRIAITCREHSRVASDTDETKCWSGAYTFTELKSIHEQLSLVHPSLGQHLPELPEEPRGVWAYISQRESPDEVISELLERYFRIAVEICGHRLLLDTLFEEHSYEEYFENISELRRRHYDEAVRNADDQLHNILFLRDGSINMLDMNEVYKQEDEALFKYNVAYAELYNYLIQPFLDMRELSFAKLREAKCGLQNPNFGDRRKQEYADMFSEWQLNYIHSLDSIQELYLEYYSHTTKLHGDAFVRMLQDKNHFGKRAFEISAQTRLNRVQEDKMLEEFQLLQSTKRQFEQQRDKVKQEIASVMEGSSDVKKQLEKLEQQVYSWQEKIFQIRLQMLDTEQSIVKNRIKAINSKYEDEASNGQFFDAVEDLDEFSSDEEELSPSKDPAVIALKEKLTVITRKKAQLRNNKKKFASQYNEKIKKKKDEEFRNAHHHQVHLKRESHKVQVEKKSDFIQEERKKTLERLRNYKMKYPSPATLRPKRRRGGQTSQETDSAAKDYVDSGSKTQSPRPAAPPVPPPATIPNNIPSPPDDIFVPTPPGPPPPPPPPGPPPPLAPLPPPPPPPPPPPLAAIPPPPPTTPAVSPSKAKLGCQENAKRQPAPDQDRGLDLSGLAHAKHNLKKRAPVSPDENNANKNDPMNDMLQLIRQGVQLRPVCNTGTPASPTAAPSDEHTQQLQEVLERITHRLQVYSDEESDGSFEDD